MKLSLKFAVTVFCTTIGTARAARAQLVRFVADSRDGSDRWTGYVERLTRDSLYLRCCHVDSVAVFPRTALRSVERQRVVNVKRAVGVGCLAVGGPLAALGYFGTHDPDSPGLEKTVGAVAGVVGCAVGAVGGLLVSAARADKWEPWPLPDTLGRPF